MISIHVQLLYGWLKLNGKRYEHSAAKIAIMPYANGESLGDEDFNRALWIAKTYAIRKK
jgi:hypothetical protein